MRQTERIALINGRIHTPNGIMDSLTVEAGRVAAVGAAPAARPSGDARVFDLQGRTVLPGFCDSHAHFLHWAMAQEQVQLGGCHSMDELLETLANFAAEHPFPAGGWYRGLGWTAENLRGATPTRHDLDAVLPNVPVILWRACEHVAAVNTAALEAAGITRDTHVERGTVELGLDGEPDGILKEAAVELVERCLPPLSDEDLTRLLHACGPLAASFGLTEIHSDDLAVFSFDFRRAERFFMDAALAGDLPFRLREQMRLPSRDLLLDFLSDGWRSGDGVPFFQIGPMKLICDGSLGGRTACLKQDYADAWGERGMALFDQEELEDLVLTAHLSGMQTALHAIGDRTLDMCLEALERAQSERRWSARHIIVHAQVADDDQLDRMRTLRLCAAIQPSFVPSDRAMARERLGQERADRSYRWRTMMRRGIVLASGSDAPIENLRPLTGIQAAVTRAAPGSGEGAWNPQECLSVAEAIAACPLNAAWCGHNEGRRGEIAPGRDADLVVLDRDPFAVHPGDLAEIGVDLTLCGGRVTHSSGRLD